MTKEARIGLLMSKSRVYRTNFIKSTEKGDSEAAAKWKSGYHCIKKEISELQEG